MSELVQISKRTGSINRVPRGVTPIIELRLEPHEQIVSVDLRESTYDPPERKTVDWRYTVVIASRLGPEAPDEQ